MVVNQLGKRRRKRRKCKGGKMWTLKKESVARKTTGDQSLFGSAA